MGKSDCKDINKVYIKVQNNLSLKIKDNPDNINIVLLYANNGTGKTRLSKQFSEVMKDKVLCYNAFFEDNFYWDNGNFKLEPSSYILTLIRDEGLQNEICNNFKSFIGTSIEPDIDTETGNIRFDIPNINVKNIKISRGEESIFIWSVFYTIVEKCIELLEENEDDRSTEIFNSIKNVVIDDPVSSMDDSRIVTVALKISELMLLSKNKLNYLITTHHPLFFNILFHKKNINWSKNNYVFTKQDDKYKLKKQEDESPFAYHHAIIREIRNAINNKELRKYHFNLFRTLLEKTSNFLGLKHWKLCLEGIENNEDFIKLIDHYSHDKLSELEYAELMYKQIDTFEETFNKFIDKYFKELEN